ncbi:MAG: glutaredoxin 3 [Rhodobiaceae bacterium]|jgi:glutaredoxin 3|nr:glutaredoxin 3 [Rhodobiaceae bacterium]
MAKIEIYTTTTCPYCHAAKDLLTQKAASFTEISVTREPNQRSTMQGRAGGRTSVPQIFIDGTHIGGCDDLYALEEKGALDTLLA